MKEKLIQTTINIVMIVLAILIPNKISGANWTDNGAYSISWYNKNQTEFNISTSQEFAGVAYLVNNNFTDFKGKTLKITSDINMSGRNWMPIGMGNTNFQGKIEGNNHTISNIYINTGTSASTYGSGIWIKLQNAEIKNLNFEGKMNIDKNYVGFVASAAASCIFDNINIVCNINYKKTDISASTSFAYSSKIAGMIGNASICTFNNVRTNSTVSYIFGSSSGSSCYGKIEVESGGIVGSGSYDTFTKCHVINHYTFVINGYETTSTYTGCGDSFVTYGGIAGTLSETSKIVGCLVENDYFKGDHPCGTFDTKRFRFGGIVGYMNKYDSSVLKNCVAINGSYNIQGHSYSWQASWYHTNSYFGGIAYQEPKNYAGCYSNNDVTINIANVQTQTTYENGSTSFSKSQMNTQSFVDELNLYSQLTFDEDYWELSSGKLRIKQESNASGIRSSFIDDENTIMGIYDLRGMFLGKSIDGLGSGIYIIKYPKTTKKIMLR